MSALKRFLTRDHYKYSFLLGWLLLGLLQAGFTELMDDEAYYWVYSRHLDWGYFDHPPMIALLIKTGYAIFHNELGVRLVMVLLNVLTLWLTWELIPQKHNRLFYLVMGAMGAMQIGGMLAVPDVPLIFFATLYFWVYRRFTEQQSWKNTLLLSLSMALMFYSKYHGILLVFFTLVSTPSLLQVFKFYIACIITALLYLPHLYWQYSHGYPSIQYHLVERNAPGYHISYSLDYILGQLLLFGPIAGWLILYYAFICPIQSSFERTLKVCLIGVLAFFLFSTFKGRVEANWTVMVFTPAVILAHQAIIRRRGSWKLLRYLTIATLIVVLITRVYMAWDFLPGVKIRPEIHHNREWAKALEDKAAGIPVVFLNSYQLASKYMFYSDGEPAYSVNSRYARRNQYNYWNTEEQLWGKPVMIAYQPGTELPVTDSIHTVKGTWEYYIQPQYYSYSLIWMVPAMKKLQVKPGERMAFVLKMRSGYHQPVPEDTAHEAVLGYAFMRKREGLAPVRSDISLTKALQRHMIRMEVTMPEQPGEYQLKFCVFAGVLPPTHNSESIKIKVEE
ncbi:glycosyltransferase family 39 protein [uncultured Chitinophaga sp.]|mgnify:CR=1 FL=1|jgi:4-amino-4-deoxy-L-arabinose transferase and related glycosyltransferases of PMT family|uniref:ArnT family glycosyltransferase n=1 Tax=uncultured Chitinophaga sp. TaxID=339340 RepID=UPI00262A7897|nr:glycosyltransferase family 39 protein [uncultured Chitinophaga sp.]